MSVQQTLKHDELYGSTTRSKNELYYNTTNIKIKNCTSVQQIFKDEEL